MKLQPILTERLKIREFNTEDLDAVYEYAGDTEVTKNMIWGPNSLEETEKFLQEKIDSQSQKDRTKYELAVVLQENENLIGGCSFELTDDGILIGYVFNKNYWGKGYATEVVKKLLEVAPTIFKTNKFVATCNCENVGSRRVLEKNGFEVVEKIEKEKKVKGRWRDTFVFERNTL